MNLLEILNTKVPISWRSEQNQNIGIFSLKDKKYKIQIDEYEANGHDLIDFGFTIINSEGKDSIEAIESNISSASVIGAVLNGAAPKIEQLNPDFILIAVMKGTGLEDSRKSAYTTIAKWMMRRLGFSFISSEWAENSKGFFKIIGKTSLSKTNQDLFISTVKTK